MTGEQYLANQAKIEKANQFFLTPIGRRFVVRPDTWNYKGRLVIPDTAKRKATTGTIIAEGESHDTLKIGDRVLYDMFSGSEMSFQRKGSDQEEHLRLLSFDEVMARINDESTVKE
jgi:co-chaperonin GroES (HSP10)